ncbi:NADP-dependent oxidoreductase domain-containing protein [Dichotomocladium elegans]|nr:NADP-dependent oxidoreductase domain-containing protein [Dichotomocladium elegans]
MASGRVFKLNTGTEIPCLGLGTWQSKPNEVYQAVLAALKAGYRAIDTAYICKVFLHSHNLGIVDFTLTCILLDGNEKEVGKAIKDSGIPREDIFLTTKMWNTFHRPDKVKEALERSLANLQTDYLDLFLMHWPVAFVPGEDNVPKDAEGKVQLDSTDFTETYAEMEKLLGDRVRAIGVSNFNIPKLEKLLKTAKVVPAVNQVELHPYLAQKDLVDFCKEHTIHVTAYSPLGSTDSPLMKNEKVLELAKKYDATPAQILLSWGIQRGTSVIPKSVTESRIISNFQDHKLEDADFQALNDLVTEDHRLINPTSWGLDIFGDK